MKKQVIFPVILALAGLVSCNAPYQGGFTKKKYLHIGSPDPEKEEVISADDLPAELTQNEVEKNMPAPSENEDAMLVQPLADEATPGDEAEPVITEKLDDTEPTESESTTISADNESHDTFAGAEEEQKPARRNAVRILAGLAIACLIAAIGVSIFCLFAPAYYMVIFLALGLVGLAILLAFAASIAQVRKAKKEGKARNAVDKLYMALLWVLMGAIVLISCSVFLTELNYVTFALVAVAGVLGIIIGVKSKKLYRIEPTPKLKRQKNFGLFLAILGGIFSPITLLGIVISMLYAFG